MYEKKKQLNPDENNDEKQQKVHSTRRNNLKIKLKNDK